MKNIKAALCLCLGLLLSGCDSMLHSNTLKLSGTLELTEHAIGARAAGRIATLPVDEGALVTKGQVLATLDRFEQAKKDFNRTKSLFDEGGSTQQMVEQAALAVDDQLVISPVDGVVLVKVHEAGEIVSAGGPVVVIGDRRRLWVRVYVAEGTVNRLSLNTPATLHFDGLKEPFKGHVVFIASKAEFTPRNVQSPEERVTQTFAVKVALDDATPNLRPGIAADVALSLNP